MKIEPRDVGAAVVSEEFVTIGELRVVVVVDLTMGNEIGMEGVEGVEVDPEPWEVVDAGEVVVEVGDAITTEAGKEVDEEAGMEPNMETGGEEGREEGRETGKERGGETGKERGGENGREEGGRDGIEVTPLGMGIEEVVGPGFWDVVDKVLSPEVCGFEELVVCKAMVTEVEDGVGLGVGRVLESEVIDSAVRDVVGFDWKHVSIKGYLLVQRCCYFNCSALVLVLILEKQGWDKITLW